LPDIFSPFPMMNVLNPLKRENTQKMGSH